MQNANLAEPPPDVSARTLSTNSGQRDWSPWESLFLARLSRFLNQDEEWRLRVPAGDWHTQLIHRAIYSTYCDCVSLGLTEDARDLVRRNQARG
jgi:hypothetical protein